MKGKEKKVKGKNRTVEWIRKTTYRGKVRKEDNDRGGTLRKKRKMRKSSRKERKKYKPNNGER